MENNYLSIAKNDYQYALRIKDLGFNNNAVAQYQQVCEKLLKSIAEKIAEHPDILRSHNLKRIYDTIKGEIELTKDTEMYLSTLSDFYTDASYPGDDFVNVTDEDVNMSYNAMVEVYDKVIMWHNNFLKSNKLTV